MRSHTPRLRLAASLIVLPALAACAAPTKCMRRGAQASMGADVARANAYETSNLPPPTTDAATTPTTPSGPRVFARIDGVPSRMAVSRGGRVFLAFPRSGAFTVGELKNGATRAFPDGEVSSGTGDVRKRLVSATALTVDAQDRLWILDAGGSDGGAKLLCVDLATDRVTRNIPFAAEILPAGARPADLAVDLAGGEDGFAFVADGGGKCGLVIVDLKSGTGRRRLSGLPSVTASSDFVAIVDGERVVPGASVGVNSLAVDPDRRLLYFCPLDGRGLSSIPLDSLEDFRASDDEVARSVESLGARPFASSALLLGRDGKLLFADYENGSVRRRTDGGAYEIVAVSPELRSPSALALADDGALLVACDTSGGPRSSAQIYRFAR